MAESTHIKATRCWGASERWPTWPAIWTAASIWQLSHNKFRQPVEVSRRQGWLLRRSHTGLSGASRRTYGCRARRSHPGSYELVQLLSQSRRSGLVLVGAAGHFKDPMPGKASVTHFARPSVSLRPSRTDSATTVSMPRCNDRGAGATTTPMKSIGSRS